MSKTSIEWTESTWNPVVGCSVISPGCTNCYAMKMAARIEAMGNQPRYAGTTRKVNGNAVWTGKLAQAPESTLLEPLRRKKPTTYFVNSMGDLFHEDCPDDWIDRVFAVMALARQHTFQVLTKRAKRMQDYMANAEREALWMNAVADLFEIDCSLLNGRYPIMGQRSPWLPLPNVWLGVSAERQQEADERIPLLLDTPAAVRFISAEPLLGPIDLTRVRASEDPHTPPDQEWLFDSLSTGDYYEQRFRNSFGEVWYDSGDGPYRDTKLDWIIVGGESGPNARPMYPDWARSLRDQCAAADVPMFFKQWGSWAHEGQCGADGKKWLWSVETEGSHVVGKKRAGRLLDGIEHNGMPQVRP